jgi:adenylate cyclase
MTVTMLQVADKYGPGVFYKFLRGKYYHPKEEERIFMFLDLNNSTALAEKLGNLKFFKLLSTYFADITDSIIDRNGEIYQYVGDEIVVSWAVERGLYRANCIQCFFDIRDELKKRSAFYLEQFGVVPEFKGGIHIGKAIVGEIGIIKKDIVYSGDILNTTARILELSKQNEQKLIITQELYDRLDTKPDVYIFHCLGEVNLRGKGELLELWTVSKDFI